MYLAFLELLLWLQAPGTGPSSAPSAEGAAAAAGGAVDPTSTCGMQAGMLAIFAVVFYFLMWRPESKRREEQENLLKSLRPGQKVRTSGGILGEIVSIDANEAVLSIGQKEKVRINVLRSHVAGLAEVAKPAEDKKADEKAPADKKADDKNDKKAEEKPAEKG